MIETAIAQADSRLPERTVEFKIEQSGTKHRVFAFVDGEILDSHKFDIADADARAKFAGRIANKLAIDAIPLQMQLLKLALQSVAPPATPTAAADEPAAPPAERRAEELAKMPADILAEAEQLLLAPDLLDRITDHFGQIGIVGEIVTALAVYLAGSSAQLPKPLAVIVRGASSSGKSYVLKSVADLFPREIVLNATSITPQALYYFPQGMLRHRFVVAGEMNRQQNDQTADATKALREMLESGRLTKVVTIKMGDELVTAQIEQEGPIAFAQTTTLGEIFEEDSNRCLLLGTDETELQTRRILRATADASSGKTAVSMERLRQIHFAIQRQLPRCDVAIPFAVGIAELFQARQIEARRSFPQLLGLVKASALLHHRQRQTNEHGQIVADIYDYTVAQMVAAKPLASASVGISPGARDYYEVLKAAFDMSDFTTTQAQAIGDGSRRTKYDRLNEIEAAGAIEQVEPPKSRVPAKWRLTGKDPATGDGYLPDAQAVLAACERAHKEETAPF